MMRVGVIGYGYWGPNLVRNFAEQPDAQVVVVADRRPERLGQVQRRYPTIRVTTDPSDLIADPAVDAVVIATPVGLHFELAMRRLARRKARAGGEADGLDERRGQPADRRGGRGGELVLMVDHTFVYTGAVQKMRELVGSGELGDLYYYDSVRINLGLFQQDVDVLWDLAVHDLSIMDFVLPQQPVAVSATGLAHVPGRPKNIAYMTMFFDGPMIAHVHASWLAPVKVRRTLLGGSRRMIVFDDLEGSEKIKVYDSGISVDPSPENVYQMLVGYRTGDMWAPKLSVTEALAVEAAHFVDCVTRGAQADRATAKQAFGWCGCSKRPRRRCRTTAGPWI